jgi:phosphonate metabolism protein PhnN/1,5-bisphosphokinase (PRPP-forming)
MAGVPGCLVLVVGQSGAGKDSILREAAIRLRGDRRFVFPRRFVTRMADRSAEDHVTISEMEFALAVGDGAFALWWRAHGNGYGIGRSIDPDLAAGRTVVINCSRTVVADALRRYPNLLVVEVTAPLDILHARIVARGRESDADAWLRVRRDVPALPEGVALMQIHNAGPLDSAVSLFHSALLRLQDSATNPGGRTLDRENKQEDGDDDGRGLIILE